MGNNQNALSDKELHLLLKGLDDKIEVPRDAAEAWRKAIRKQQKRDAALRSYRRWCELAAGLLLTIGLGLYFGRDILKWNKQPVQPTEAISAGQGSDLGSSNALTESAAASLYDFTGAVPGEAIYDADRAAVLYYAADDSYALNDDFDEVFAEESAYDQGYEILSAQAVILTANTEAAVAQLEAVMRDYGAYTEQNIQTGNGTQLTVRVSPEDFEALLAEIENAFNIETEAKTEDAESRLQRLKDELDTLYTTRVNAEASVMALTDEINKIDDKINEKETELAELYNRISSAAVQITITAE
ncbi:MAG: DUF4349 domain-containing protein [Clostridia bacterium]|nr:DUF4349 domain-containing protein [Clostridia bacterium]